MASSRKQSPPTFEFYIVQGSYKVIEGKPVILLFGRSVEGEQICCIDRDFTPYFYAIPVDETPIAETIGSLEKIELEEKGQHLAVTSVERITKRFLGEEREVLKVFVNIPAAVPPISKAIMESGMARSVHEYDIPFVRRYYIDKGVSPMTKVSVTGSASSLKLKVPGIEIQEIKQLEEESFTAPTILGIDIETYLPDDGVLDTASQPILMIAFSAREYRHCITWRRFETDDPAIEFVASEAELLERTREVIERIAPDIITGYFSDGFDLPYMDARAQKYKVPLQWGLDYSNMRVDRRGQNTATITGITHIDVFKFVRTLFARSMKSDSLSLGAVAEEILGDSKDEVDILKLSQAWDNHSKDLLDYCLYNIKDADLARRLLESMMPNVNELVKIIGQEAYDVNRMRFSQMVEWFLLRQAFMFNEIAPNKPTGAEIQARRSDTFEGAFVYQPEPGMYDNIVVFDFRSLYPSIIVSHNLSIETLDCSCCDENCAAKLDAYEGGSHWVCSKRRGFIASVIGDLITRRGRVKEMLKKNPDNLVLKARSEGLKILANSFYGYLSFAAARWYSLDCAKATTALGRYYIKKVIAEAKENGFGVIYSDTDSVFLTAQNLKEVRRFADKINLELPGIMELEFQGHYKRGLFVSMRSQETGAKKKYALFKEDGRMDIKGFESVRRNTSPIAREVQEEVLARILRDNAPDEAVSYLKDIVSKVSSHEMPVERFVVSTRISKPLRSYDAIGPHVRVAQIIQEETGRPIIPGQVVSYVIKKGKGSISSRADIPERVEKKEYDDDYYITHQILPAVERIFSLFNIDIAERVAGAGQSTLDGFF